ncbi:flagellin [Methylorubrum podarium]|uniref:Flagellin n=1 Tax=Methylorubrum podarium TaxID=200476 RepID=A0ABV1QT10_9HYPH
MTSLLTNISSMSALTTLKSITHSLDITSRRISTGQRTSSASDNAAYWSIATTMRTDNAVLSAIRDTLGLGAAAVDAAYQGTSSVLADLRSLRAKLQTALQPGVDRAKVQTEVGAIQDRMRATARASGTTDESWLAIDSAAGGRSVRQVVSGFTRDASGAVRTSSIPIESGAIALYDAGTAQVTVPATPARITAGEAIPGATDLSGTASVRFDLSVDGAPARPIVLSGATMISAARDLAAVTPDELVRAINNLIAADPDLAGTVHAGLDEAGRLWFETTEAGAGRTLALDRTGASGPGVDLAVNGGFEAGLAGWTVGANTSWNQVRAPARSGTAGYAMGTSGTPTTVSQTLATVPGQSYLLSFWLKNDPGGTSNFFKADWNGATVVARGADPAGPFIEYHVTVTATGPTSVLTFEARQDTNWWYLDDVSVTGTGGADVTLGFGAGASDHRVAAGSDAATAAARGLLDTVDPASGVSVDTIDLTAIGSGTAADAALARAIDTVERAIARVTESGVRLGASRTQIEGQRSFLDTLMKANDRTIGILVDADIEEESTRLKALQTQQQLAVQALSIANASSQPVLSLFRP